MAVRSMSISNPPSAGRRYKPTARECSLLLLHLVDEKERERGKPVTRFRIAELSLSRLWGRRRINPDFIEEVAEWLSEAGFALFFAGSTYGVVRTAVVESWIRIGSKRIEAELRQVSDGTFDFEALEPLLNHHRPEASEDE